jgi:hypothetical protein
MNPGYIMVNNGSATKNKLLIAALLLSRVSEKNGVFILLTREIYAISNLKSLILQIDRVSIFTPSV